MVSCMYLVWCARASAYLARADLAARAPRLRPLATRCRCPTHAHYYGGRSVALPAAAIAAAAIAATNKSSATHEPRLRT